MSQLIIANVAAPFVLSQTGNILIFFSIILVEMLVIFLCLKSLEIAMGFSRLLVAVLVANIAPSIVGIPLLFYDRFSIKSGSEAIILLISFLSFYIEFVIYSIFFQTKKIPNDQILLFSFLSNLASYIILYLALIFTWGYNNGGSPFVTSNPPMISWKVRSDRQSYISWQRNFYYEKNPLANNWE